MGAFVVATLLLSALAHARGWLGISIADTPSGVVVREVLPDSPALAAGLAQGDLLQSLDGRPVKSASTFLGVMAQRQAGDLAEITISRAGKIEKRVATLQVFPRMEDIARKQLVGRPAPALANLTAVRGSLPEPGTVVLLDFWASWCVPCKLASRRLEIWQQRHAAQGLRVVPISAEPQATVTRAADAMGLGPTVFADENETVTSAYHVRSYPTAVLVDRAGVVQEVVLGFGPNEYDALYQRVLALLATPAPKDHAGSAP